MLNNDFSNQRPLTEEEHIRQGELIEGWFERFYRRLDWNEFPLPPAKPKGDER